MGNPKRKKTKRKIDKRLIIFIILAILYACFWIYNYYHSQQEEEPAPQIEIVDVEPLEPEEDDDESNDQTAPPSSDTALRVHMIDCGQGDSFLFEYNGKYGLIDAGDQEHGDDVVAYLEAQGVKKLNFIVGTHQHDDHMGGLVSVLQKYKPNTLYMPSVSADYLKSSWYKKVAYLIETKEINVKNPKVGDKFKLGDVTFKVVGQLSEDEMGKNLNNISTVIKVTYGDMDLLMTGDAESVVEKSMLDSNQDLDCEILKMGHHGSDTSSKKAFLEAVSPEYALISAGVGNKYKHPSTSTMENLKSMKIKVYRTDEMGSVIITITKAEIFFDHKKGDYLDGVSLGTKRGFDYAE